MERSIVKKIRMTRDTGDEYIDADPSVLFAMVWPLTVDAWAFKGEQIAEQRLQRDVTAFTRRKRQTDHNRRRHQYSGYFG